MKNFRLFIFIIYFSIHSAIPVAAQYINSFNEYMNLGQQALASKSYHDALKNFQAAHTIDPQNPVPIFYINKIQELKQQPYIVEAASFRASYEYYYLLAERALERGDYMSASRFLDIAQQKTTRRMLLPRRVSKPMVKTYRPPEKQKLIMPRRKAQAISKEIPEQPPIDFQQKAAPDVGKSVVETRPPLKRPDQRRQAPVPASDFTEEDLILKDIETLENQIIQQKKSKALPTLQQQRVETRAADVEQAGARAQQRTIDLDDKLWARQPDMELEIDLNETIILRGHNIQRFLAVTPQILNIERLNQDEILIKPEKRGMTFLYVWEPGHRWSFHVKVILRELQESAKIQAKMEQQREVVVDPFRIKYSNDWGSLNRGSSFTDMDRQSLVFTQMVGVEGPTPMGDFDASINTFRFEESTEVVGERIGLTGGDFGIFEDYTIRGADTFGFFSSLSIPGRHFRGFLFDSYSLDRNIQYTALYGRDRNIFSLYSPSALDFDEDSFIEGAQFTLFPDEKPRISLNYARGYGRDRSDDLKDRVYSIEAWQEWNETDFYAEAGYDDDVIAYTLQGEQDREHRDWRLSFRDIDEDYRTIGGAPTGRGEIGTIFDYEYTQNPYEFTAYTDLFRDRTMENPDAPDAVNVDFNSSYTYYLTDLSRWRTSLYSRYTPQLISSQKSFSIDSTYYKTFFALGKRQINVFSGPSFQIVRYEDEETSEYNRYGLRSGFQINITQQLMYFLNYDYFWATDVAAEETTRPRSLLTGLYYSRVLSRQWYGNISLNYRDEEATESNFSFLSGEDSVESVLGLTFTPTDDVQIFNDNRFRTVWTENNTKDSYNEVDLRMGVRAEWDSVFRWSPLAFVSGHVYKDYNGNGLYDEGEPGVPNIGVRVGDAYALTDQKGFYDTRVTAKKAIISLDPKTLPKGFVLSSSITQSIEVSHLASYTRDFGLTVRSGIYGVAYVDLNNNNTLDTSDRLVSDVEIVMDGEVSAVTDHAGAYFFDQVSPGKHSLNIKLESIPIQFLPKIKLNFEVTLDEGETETFHIPLQEKEIQDQSTESKEPTS